MNDNKEWPYSARLCAQLLMITLIGFIISWAKALLVPVYFSGLLAILLLSLANSLERAHFPRPLANFIPVLLALIVIATIIYLFSFQGAAFLSDIPSIKQHISEHYNTIQQWIEEHLNISTTQQAVMLNKATENIKDSGTQYIGFTVLTATQTITFIVLGAVYTFLILFYRHTIRHFLLALFQQQHKKNVEEVISGSRIVIRKYMQGLLIEMTIISACNSLILLIIGVKYAIFLGVLTGILNIIPYIGIYSGILFTILVTLTTNASMHQITWIIISFIIIHFIDTNFLVPRIVGSKVKINALMTITGAFIGGLLIGIPGVFFALPTIAILKIIFDRIDELKPWGILLGDDLNGNGKSPIVRRIKKLASAKH